MKRLLSICVLTALMVMTFSGQAAALEPLGTQLPELVLPSTTGDLFNLQELAKGKVTLLVYWSVTCPHCQVEMPGLVALSKKLAGNPFQMITISTDSPAMIPAVQAMADDYGLPEPVLMDMGAGDALPVAEYYDIVMTPTLLLLDKQGKLIFSSETEPDNKKLPEAISGAF